MDFKSYEWAATHDSVEEAHNKINILREQFLDYICKKPDELPNPQWVEERLRALELQMKSANESMLALQSMIVQLEHNLEAIKRKG